MLRRRTRRVAALWGSGLVAALTLAGCFLIGPQEIEGRQEAIAGLTGGRAELGVVVRGSSGAMATGARVEVLGRSGGALSAGVDEVGIARVSGLVAGPVAVRASAPSHADGWARVVLADERTAATRIPLAPLASGTIHQASRGGAIAVHQQHALAFPADAFRRTDGSLATGNVQVSLAWGQPGTSSLPAAVASGEDGASQPIEIVAAVYLGPATAGTEPLQLVEPATYRVDVARDDPVRTRSGVSLYHLDPSEGLWEERGPVQWEPRYAAAEIDAGGWWAIGVPRSTETCVSGRVLLAGVTPLAGVEVVAVPVAGGPGGAGMVRSHTASDGSFCLRTALDSDMDLRLTGFERGFGSMLSEERTVHTPSRSGVCGDPTCLSLGVIALTGAADADGDGFFAGAGGDCDDSEPLVRPGAEDPVGPGPVGEGIDENCDGVDGVDGDGDGVEQSADCDDTDPAAYPGGTEICDGRDNDCDGLKDEDVPDSVLDAVGVGCLPCREQATIDLGPKLYWGFDGEDGGFMPDGSGWGRDGELGQPFSRWYTGIDHDGSSVPYFDGDIGQHVRLYDVDAWPADALTVSVWFKATHRGTGLVSYAVDAGDEKMGNEFVLFLAPDDGLNIYFDEVGYSTLDLELPERTWHHVVVTWRKSGQIAVYLDGGLAEEGVLVEDQDDTGYQPPLEVEMEPGGRLYVGQEQDCYEDGCFDAFQSFEGLVDELAIFDRVLSQAEILALYRTTTCGEGGVCNHIDDDGDGQVDERLVGSESCPAADCDEVEELGASVGTGGYWVDFDLGDEPVFAWCDFEAGEMSWCGDGLVDEVETCDPPGVDCVDCAIVTGLRDCEEIRRAGYVLDGPYYVDPDGAGGSAPYLVRCDLTEDGGGWTLIHHYDIASSALFAGQGLNTTAADPLFADETAPYSLQYSLLGRLEDLRGAGGFQFRMRWPQASVPKQNIWIQTSNPTLPGPIEGYVPVDVQATSHGFRGLELVDPPPPSDWTGGRAFIDGGQGTYEPWYAIGLVRPATTTAFGLPATVDITIMGDGTTPEVELWVKPVE